MTALGLDRAAVGTPAPAESPRDQRLLEEAILAIAEELVDETRNGPLLARVLQITGPSEFTGLISADARRQIAAAAALIRRGRLP